MANRLGIIYMATNLTTGKAYIGVTTKSLSCRINKHYRDSVRYTYAFANALRKYPPDNWKWTILYEDIPRDTLGLAETCMIFVHDTYNNGYNSTMGGEDNPMNYASCRRKVSLSKLGKPRPDQSRRITLINKNREYTGEMRSRISDRTSGARNSMYGKSHSVTSRLAIAQQLGSRSFRVYQNGELIGTWINKKECARALGIDNSSITKYLNKGRKNSLGFTFVYEEMADE